jgi:hypothetical protein
MCRTGRLRTVLDCTSRNRNRTAPITARPPAGRRRAARPRRVLSILPAARRRVCCGYVAYRGNREQVSW